RQLSDHSRRAGEQVRADAEVGEARCLGQCREPMPRVAVRPRPLRRARQPRLAAQSRSEGRLQGEERAWEAMRLRTLAAILACCLLGGLAMAARDAAAYREPLEHKGFEGPEEWL